MKALTGQTTGQTGSRSVPLLWACTALLAGAGAILTMMEWGDLKPADAYPTLVMPIAAFAYATLGAVIVRRVGNRVGLVLLGEGLGLALVCLTSAYAILGLVTDPGPFLPATCSTIGRSHG